MAPGEPLRRFDETLFVLSAMAAALAIGSVHTLSLCIVSVPFAFASYRLWRSAPVDVPRASANALLGLAVGLTAYTGLQAIPLPASFVAAIAPNNAAIWRQALTPLGELGPEWHPISLDPIATRVEFLRGVVYVVVFLGALRIASRREGVIFLGSGLVVSATVLTVASVIHPALGAERVFGLYRPENPIFERHISPLLNANTLSAYLNIGVCLTLAAALVPRPPVPKSVLAAVGLMFVAMQIWIGSRGGVIAMTLGVALVFAMVWGTRSRRRASRSGWIPMAALGIATVAMTVLAASKDALKSLADADLSKLAVHKQMLSLVSAYKWFGVGRGSFESAYPAHRTIVGHATYTHPEHFLIQWASEWGLPIALVAVATIAWSLRPKVVLARNPLVIGPWAALAVSAVHNLVDLSSEVPGVVVALVICAAIVVGGPSSGSREPSRADEWASHPRTIARSILALTAIGLATALSTVGKDLYTDRYAVRDLARSSEIDAGRFLPAARAAMSRHPAEPYLPFAGALFASRVGSPEVVRWTAATIERAQVYGPAHLLVGRFLRELSPSQARLEYRLAMTQAPELQTFVLHEAIKLVENFDEALELVPQRKGREDVLQLIAGAIGNRLPATQALLDEELLRRDPSYREPTVRVATRAIRDVSEPWCAESIDECKQLALDRAKSVSDRFPDSCQGRALKAQAIAAGGDLASGIAHLREGLERFEDRGRCLAILVKLAVEAKQESDAASAIEGLVHAPCSSERECLSNLYAAAEAENAMRHVHRALMLYRKAAERYPTEDGPLERVARTAVLAGLHAEAADTFGKLAKRHPTEARWREAADRERALVSATRPDAAFRR